MPDDENQSVPTDPQETLAKHPQPKEEVPEAFRLQDLMSQAYKAKLERLKRGGVSGISEAFRSAADLFFEDTEPVAPPKLDWVQLKPHDADLFARRAYLAHLMRVISRDIVNIYLDECQNGQFGPKIKAVADPSDEVFSALIKELACVNICLTRMEQIDNESPAWASDYLRESIPLLDSLVIGPAAVRLLQLVDGDSKTKTYRAFTANLCRELGFGEVGDPCWNFIYFKIKGVGQLRYNILHSSLARPIEDIASELGQL